MSEPLGKEALAPGYQQAALVALEQFPLNVDQVELCSQSENLTYRVAAKNADTDYVLRLHRPGYCTFEELKSERIWTRALRDTGLTLQEPLATHAGDWYVEVDIPGVDEQRYAGVTTWQEGELLREYMDSCDDSSKRQQIMRRFGEISAICHEQSANWQPPAEFTRRRLDLDALLGEEPFWGRFWEHDELTDAEQQTLLRARAGMREVLEAYGESPTNFSVIHADLTPENILYDGDDLVVIDFDDAAYGWHAYDIASVLVECRFDRDFESLQSAFLEGYTARRPLAQRDIDVLADFDLVRGMAIIGWFHQRPEYAGAEYFSKFMTWVVDECRRRGF